MKGGREGGRKRKRERERSDRGVGKRERECMYFQITD